MTAHPLRTSPSVDPARAVATRRGALPPETLAHLGTQLQRAFEPTAPGDDLAPFATLLAALEQHSSTRHGRTAAEALREALIGSIPALRAFAFSLTYDPDRADDLVQDTLVRAWAKADTFTPGTHLIAWLFTILRNLFYSEQRKRKREVEDVNGALAEQLSALPEQEVRVELAQFGAALSTLPPAQREALILIGAQGFSYEETAQICGVAVGTIKSRVNRARTLLVERLGMAGTGDIGTDATTRAAMGER